MQPASASVFQDIIRELVRESGALTAMLVTRHGTVVAEAGDRSIVNSAAMAALVAGMFSATKEVARMIGEDQFSILLQQGTRRDIHISLVPEGIMIVIVFEDHSRIGMMRLAARKAGEKVTAAVAASREQERSAADLSVEGFRDYALSLIDHIFLQ